MELCPKIILEGIRMTHKADIAIALNEHPLIASPRKYRYHTPLISGEWCGFTNYPWGYSLGSFAGHGESLAMDSYRTWLKLFQQQHFYSWNVDHFHISTQTYQSIHRGKLHIFGWLALALKEQGFHLVIWHSSAESFAQARADRAKISGNLPSMMIGRPSCMSRRSWVALSRLHACQSCAWTSRMMMCPGVSKPSQVGWKQRVAYTWSAGKPA